MSMYNPDVKIALDELCSLKSAASSLVFVRKELDAEKEKKNKNIKECAEAISKMKAELNAANEAAEKLREELDERTETIPTLPKMSKKLAASFDRATITIKNTDNPPPLIAVPNKDMILDALKDIVHEVAVYFTTSTNGIEENPDISATTTTTSEGAQNG